MKEQVEAEIQSWIDNCMATGRVPCLVRDMLLQNGYSLAAIQTAMGANYPPESLRMGAFRDYQQIADIALTKRAGDAQVSRVESDHVSLYVIDDFLSKEQCLAVVDVAFPTAERSVLANGEVMEWRTSSTCYIRPEQGDIVNLVDKKIAEMLGIQLGYSELIQAQFYEEGQEYKQHADFFGPKAMQEARQTLLHPGQRTWTFMVYLEAPESGGQTRFTELDIEFVPRQGQALAWFNLNVDGSVNRYTRHQSLPVNKGRKSVITKWFRDEGTGNIFFDENG